MLVFSSFWSLLLSSTTTLTYLLVIYNLITYISITVAMQSPKIIKMSSSALLQIIRTFLDLEGKYKQLTDILDKFRVFVTDLPTTCNSDELSKGMNIRCFSKLKLLYFQLISMLILISPCDTRFVFPLDGRKRKGKGLHSTRWYDNLWA